MKKVCETNVFPEVVVGQLPCIAHPFSSCAPNAWELPPITNQLINPSMSNCPGTGYFGSIQHIQDIYVSCILVQHKPHTHYIQHLQHIFFC